jgi:hypothetical protein
MEVLNVDEPHQETNEDGHTYTHPGYNQTECLECNARIFTARSQPMRRLCGTDHCVSKKK